MLGWWKEDGAKAKFGIICDGAVRSGKTVSMFLSFTEWAFATFNGAQFAICGKTIISARRNIVYPYMGLIENMGYECNFKVSQNTLEIKRGQKTNTFYIYGGCDEGSAALIQGITLGGVLFDEVALMPKSFVEQAIARCSKEGAKLWFNCNPEGPYHWFYLEWVLKAKERHMVHIHFKMSDNPSLSKKTLKRYETQFSGVFYERYVLGRWVQADGLVYPMFKEEKHVKTLEGCFTEFWVSVDYGTQNPFSAGLWGKTTLNGRAHWHRLGEYYHSGRETNVQLTDEEYYWEVKNLIGKRKVTSIIVDPSAASFIEVIKRHGEFKAVKADNDIMKGISFVCSALKENLISFNPTCVNSFKEFALYQWETNTATEKPKKINDHAMDDIRYFVATVMHAPEQERAVFLSVKR